MDNLTGTKAMPDILMFAIALGACWAVAYFALRNAKK